MRLARAVARAEASLDGSDSRGASYRGGTAASRPTDVQSDSISSNDVETELKLWAVELIDCASISSLMRQHWGWTCQVDVETRSNLAAQLLDLDSIVREIKPAVLAFEQRAGQDGSEKVAEPVPIRNLRGELQQAEAHRREVAVLLEAVQRRLALIGEPSAASEPVASAVDAWTARK